MDHLLTLAPFIVVALLVTGALWLVRPDLLAYFVWPSVLLYPKHLMHGALPLNAGVNDALIVGLAIRLLVHPVNAEGPYYRWGRPVVWLAVGMWLMQMFSEIGGSLTTPAPLMWIVTLRNALKGVVFISFAFVMVRTITNEAAFRRHLVVFMVTISVAFVLVWVCSWSPTTKWVFEDLGTRDREIEYAYVQATRSWGPFDFTTGLGIMIAAVVPLGMGVASSVGGGLARGVAVAMVATAGVAELVTKTRSALTGIAVVLLGWIVISKYRWRIIGSLAVIGVVAVAFAITSGEGSKLEARVQSDRAARDYDLRLDVWRTVITHPNPLMVAFGEGEAAMAERLHVNPHSAYLDAIFLWGLGGLAMFAIFFACTVRWSRQVSRDDRLPLGHGVGWGTMWGVVSIAVTSLTADTWFTSDYRFLMYFLLAAIWQRREAILAMTSSRQWADSGYEQAETAQHLSYPSYSAY